jgi:hypothetical protein
MRKTLAATVGAAALVLSTAAPALAAVTFDSATGTGFVGKGDVQLAFAWKNSTLQTNAKDVSFSYEAVDAYEAVCTFITGDGTRGEKVHNVDHKTKSGVKAALSGDPRQTKGQNQFTGFNLSGFDGEPQTVGGEVPVEGGPCPGNAGHDGTWTSVTWVSGTGGLYATFGSVSHLLQ